MSYRWIVVCGVLAIVTGCSRQDSPPKTVDGKPAAGKSDNVKVDSGKAEGEIRTAFADLQAALKEGSGAKLWDLLDTDSQEDANRAAKLVQEAYAKAKGPDQAEMEKGLALSGKDLANLSGKVYLQSKRFLGKYHEIPGSKLDRVVVQGDSATLHYIEDDGDKEKLTYNRQQGRWKVSLAMPKAAE